jgi:hypothetical protein
MKTPHAVPLSFLIAILLSLAPTSIRAQSQAVPTKVMVRAVAHDAKIIGSNVGGVWITIQEAATGKLLADGLQEGGTGDTGLLVTEPPPRGEKRYGTDGAAGFLATLLLQRPTFVDITAYGPLDTPHALQRTTKRLLLVPGKDVIGEGIILELNGFSVKILDPSSESASAGQPLAVRASVTMLCGCPTEPGGLWDADDMEVVARITREGEVIAEAPLSFTGTASTYEGELSVSKAGAYTLEVLAMDVGKGNFGIAQRSVAIAP